MDPTQNSTQRSGEDSTYRKVFVGGLPWSTSSDSLRMHFEQFGALIEATVIADRQTGRSKGYGFVTFASDDAASRATAEPNPIIDGRRANCNLAYLGARKRDGDPGSMRNPGFQGGAGFQQGYGYAPQYGFGNQWGQFGQYYPQQSYPQAQQYAMPQGYDVQSQLARGYAGGQPQQMMTPQQQAAWVAAYQGQTAYQNYAAQQQGQQGQSQEGEGASEQGGGADGMQHQHQHQQD